MSPQLLEAELNGNTKEELELIRFKIYLLADSLVGQRVTISKFRFYGDVRNSAVNAGHEIVRQARVR